MNRTLVRPESPEAVAVALVSAESAGSAGGTTMPSIGGPTGLENGAAVLSVERILPGLDAARELVASASQAGLASADSEVLTQVIAAGGRLRSAAEALLLAAAASLEAIRAGSGRAALRSEARFSARSAARAVAVSEQVAQMPNVARGLACGALTPEHVEVLADTARRSSPQVVNADPGLLDTAAHASPDVLRRDAKEFVASHDPAAAEGELARQRRDRSAALFTDDRTGMGVLNARFDAVSFALVTQAVENYNDALWRRDGGRDGTPDATRDNRQRLADSVFEMLTGRNAPVTIQHPSAARSVGGSDRDRTPPGASVSDKPAPGGDAPLRDALTAPRDPTTPTDNDHPPTETTAANSTAPAGGASDGRGGGDSAGGVCDMCTGSDVRSVTSWTPSGAPNQIIVIAEVGVVDGTKPDGRCEVLDVGPVPPSILDSISPDTRITGALFDRQGQPLWLGRSRRHATAAQQLVIALRDRGCVLCRAPMHRCQYHHIDEWNADNGTTDPPNLAALCTSCHKGLHNNGQRLHRDPDSGHWSTPARPTADGVDGDDGDAHPGAGEPGRSPP